MKLESIDSVFQEINKIIGVLNSIFSKILKSIEGASLPGWYLHKVISEIRFIFHNSDILFALRGIKKTLGILSLPLGIISLALHGLVISDAYAYIDPGSGSIIAQALIGALIGVGIAVKIYWEKLKFKLSTTFSRK